MNLDMVSFNIHISTSRTPSFWLTVFARYRDDQLTLDKDPASFCSFDGRQNSFTVLVLVLVINVLGF